MPECYPLQSIRTSARSARPCDSRWGDCGEQGRARSAGVVALRLAGVAATALLVANCAGQVERQGGQQDRFNKKYGVQSK